MANKSPSTQDHLDIEDFRDDLIVLKNGNIALVLETNSLNFELLAEDEQDAKILSFANLLNSLTFPIQIVIRTERADVNDYIDSLIAQRDKHISVGLRRQMEIYLKFVQNLTVKTEILNKRFFIVVTTSFVTAAETSSLVGSLLSKPKKLNAYGNLEKGKNYLYPKRDFLLKQFKSMGLKIIQLNNDQLTQLFYDIYDPDKVGIKRVNLEEESYTAGMVSPLTEELMTGIPRPGGNKQAADDLPPLPSSPLKQQVNDFMADIPKPLPKPMPSASPLPSPMTNAPAQALPPLPRPTMQSPVSQVSPAGIRQSVMPELPKPQQPNQPS